MQWILKKIKTNILKPGWNHTTNNRKLKSFEIVQRTVTGGKWILQGKPVILDPWKDLSRPSYETSYCRWTVFIAQMRESQVPLRVLRS